MWMRGTNQAWKEWALWIAMGAAVAIFPIGMPRLSFVIGRQLHGW